MHLKRWLTALVLLPLLMLLLFRGGRFAFFLLVSAVSLAALREYFQIVFLRTDGGQDGGAFRNPPAQPDPGKRHLEAFAFFSSLLLLWCAHRASFELMLLALALNLTGAGVILLLRFKSDPFIFENIAKQVTGVIYVPFFLSFLILIRSDALGVYWVLAFLLIIFAGDTAAFYVGSYLGKHKLSPSLSPGKTIEGAVGGLAANLGTGAALKSLFLPESTWGASLLFFIGIGVVGQAGDLFESGIKRTARVKDSGGILPGHGGILDRIDALLFAAPTAYFFKVYLL